MAQRIFPAVDLHLLVNAEIPLRAFASGGGSWIDLATQPVFAMELYVQNPSPPPPPAIVELTNTRKIVGRSVGSTLATLRLRWEGANPTQRNVAMRFTVHHAIRQILLPQPAITVETDRSDRVLTVYGRFETASGQLSTHDITSHPYLQYSITTVSGSPAVTVDPATGRLTSGGSPGTARITISIADGLATPNPTATLDVHVVEAPVDRPILRRVHEGTAIRKRSILFVSEGFTQQEEPRFNRLAKKLGRHLVTAMSPYNLLRESLDLFSAFVPSQESGVTFGPPLVGVSENSALPAPPDQQILKGDFEVNDLLNTLGNPAANPNLTFAQAATVMNATPYGIQGLRLKAITYESWRSLQQLPPQSRARETAFGMMIGERRYGQVIDLRELPPASSPQDNQEIPDVHLDLLRPRFSNRTPTFDERRLPDLTAPGADPSTAHLAAQDQFVRSLRALDGQPGFGSIWATGGDCFGLVVYLVNSDHYAGVRGVGYLAMSVGPGILLRCEQSLHVPGLVDVSPILRFPSGGSGFREAPIDMLVDVIAHELAHSDPLGSLGDEYGFEGDHAGGPPNSPEAIAHIESSPNTQTLVNARGGAGPAIRGDLLKWNWERVQAAANVESRSGSGTTLNIVLVAEDFWRWPKDSVGRAVFLRTKNLKMTNSPRSTDLIVRAVDPTEQVILLEIPPSTNAEALIDQFPAGSTLVLPRLDAGAVTRLVHPLVIAAMTNGPFAASATTNCVKNPTQAPPAVIAGFTFPSNAKQTLGAYETAAGFDCGAVRPAAECKMRTTAKRPTDVPVDFCFACKYAIVDAVDCGAHGELDKEYPR